MLNSDGLTRSEDGEGGLLAEVNGVVGRVLDLDTAELGSGTRVLVSDGESLSGQLGKRAERVVEGLQGLITSVGDGCLDLQVVDTIDGLGASDLESESRSSRNCNGGSREGNQGRADGGGEHGLNC